MGGPKKKGEVFRGRLITTSCEQNQTTKTSSANLNKAIYCQRCMLCGRPEEEDLGLEDSHMKAWDKTLGKYRRKKLEGDMYEIITHT